MQDSPAPPRRSGHVLQKDRLNEIRSATLAGVVNGRDLVFSAGKMHGELEYAANMVRDTQDART